MSTRGCIARLTNEDPLQFKGVYHHWDSYPSGLGKMLFLLRAGRFRMNTELMLQELIAKHPAGWSTIVGRRFDRTPSFKMDEPDDLPQCYCHGGRNEQAWAVTESNASGSGVEYVYAFTGSRMLILGSYLADGAKMIGMFGVGDERASWTVIADIDLNGPEPDWEAIDERAATAPVRASSSPSGVAD